MGGRRQMHNYVTAKQDQMFIETPPDEYKPNKLDESVTVDKLQQQRNMDVPVSNALNFSIKQWNYRTTKLLFLKNVFKNENIIILTYGR